jgi:hypothetical protein
MITLPPLKIRERDREYRNYTRECREKTVIAYLFNGLSHRAIDDEILGLNSAISKGYQAMGILHHYGLDNEHKGIFKGMKITEVLDNFPDEKEYDFLYDILKDSIDGCDAVEPIIVDA